MNFFRRYALLCMMMMVSAVALAIPAKPGLTRKIQLSDGTSITARLTGDEHAHYWLGDDGKAYTLTDDKAQQIDVEAIKSRASVRRQQSNARRVKRLAPRRVGEVGGITGQKKGLIILVNFSDVSFKSANNNALYQRIANEENFSYGNFKGSMYDYFKKQSLGKFELTFDVIGPVEVSQTQAYYGSNDSQGNDKYPAKMVIEALKLADSQVNYADYDWDGDGEVEQVYVVYAGKGEADGGAATTIWPHEWELSSAAYYGDGSGAQTLDGVKIDTYACGGELDGQTGSIAGIGTMCHEFSHCLGYPDFYDTDYSGGQGMGYWDLMDGGSYNGDGYQPAGYTSYERWVAGWAEPEELTATKQVSNMPDLQTSGKSYIIYNPGNKNEYYLLENRQQTGWDAGIPGAGLLILHVDYSASAWSGNTPNDDPSHPRMTWIAADNKYQYETYQGSKYYTVDGMANDPFPYGSVNAFNKSTTPAAQLYNKNTDGTYYLDSSVEEITQNSNGTISFKFVGVSNVATPTFSPKAGRYAEAQTVTISCETAGATIYYTLDGTTPTTSSTRYTQPLTISETTTVKAIAVSDGEESATATAKYTIGTSTSDPDTKTFRLVSSVDELESGMRYIIACGSKAKAAGSLNSLILGSEDVSVSGDVITIGSGVSVFVLEGDQENGWTFQNESTEEYLYATNTKKLAYSTSEENWTLSNGTAGVIMAYGSCGTMLYNVGSPRFTTYTSSPNASMIQANLYIEESSATPVTPDPLIVADESLSFETKVGTPQTLTFEVLSEDLTENITATLTDANGVFSLSPTTISRTASEEGATVNVTFAPTQVGTFTATVTLTSAGADPVTVSLSGTATEATTPVDPADDGTQFKRVASVNEIVSGKRYIIACGSKEVAAGELNNKLLAPVDVTVSDDIVTLADGVAVFVLSGSGSSYSLKNESTGQYLNSATAKSMSYSDSEVAWTLSNGTDGVEMTCGSSGTLTYNVSSPRITTYTSNATATMIRVNLYMEVGSSDDPDQPVITGNHYALVSDASTLAAGDKIVIAYINAEEETYQALSTTQNNNNRAATSDVTINDDGTLTAGESVQVITLEKDGTNFLFNVGEGYLYAANSTENYLRTETTADANAKATIAIAGDSATIVFQGTNTHNTLRYNPNNGTPLFSCYSSTSAVGGKPQIYRKVKQTTPSVVGDVNRDGQVSIADVTALVNIILGKDDTEPYQYDHDAADVNTDGGISIADVTALVNSILGKDENQ